MPAEALAKSILSITSPFQTRRRGVEIRLVAGEIKANPDAVLVRTLIKAHRWVEEIRDGSSITDIAQRDGHADAFVRIRAQLAFLTPRIQNAILDGTQPPELYLECLVCNPIPLDSPEQEKRFGFTA